MRLRNTITVVLLGMAVVLSSGRLAEAATTRPIIYSKNVWEGPDGMISGGLFAARGGKKWQLTDHPGDREPSVSRDGSRIVFVREGDLYGMAADGSRQRQLTSGLDLDELPQISPDGSQVLFVRRSGVEAPGDLYIVPFNGGNTRALAPFPGDDHDASFSPDGKSIVFVRSLPVSGSAATNGELFSVRPDGSGLTRLTRTPYDEARPLYFARGIVFNRRKSVNGCEAGIYVMRRDGTRVRPLFTWPRLRAQVKAVSPNGRLLVFSTVAGDTWAMRLIGPTQRSRRPRKFAGWTAEHLVFSPDGRRIAGAFENTSSEVSPFYVLTSIDVHTGIGQGAVESWEPEETGSTRTSVGPFIAW